MPDKPIKVSTLAPSATPRRVISANPPGEQGSAGVQTQGQAIALRFPAGNGHDVFHGTAHFHALLFCIHLHLDTVINTLRHIEVIHSFHGNADI